jgi:phage recombination protein Bet
MGTEIQKADERSVEFLPYGNVDKIKLSVRIIQNMIAVPTKSGRTCSDSEAMKFAMLCRARRLDPFQGDAFLIGYDTQNGPQFNLITSHQALLKRAELHPEFDGMQSGVIVRGTEGGEPRDREGDFHLEEEILIGAWAKVFFKQRKIPSTDRIALKNFAKTYNGKLMGRWNDDPEGQLVKCAEASALRKAFPTMCGGMFLRQEMESSMLGESIGSLPMPSLEVETGKAKTPDDDGDLGPQSQPQTQTPTKPAGGPASDSPQAQLAALAAENSLSFDAYQKWAVETGNDEGAGSRGSWDEVPSEICTRLLRSRVGFVKQVKQFEKGGK